MKIRSYESFKGCINVVIHYNFYYTLYRTQYEECAKRLRMLKAFEPEKYNEWLHRWKYESRR